MQQTGTTQTRAPGHPDCTRNIQVNTALCSLQRKPNARVGSQPNLRPTCSPNSSCTSPTSASVSSSTSCSSAATTAASALRGVRGELQLEQGNRPLVSEGRGKRSRHGRAVWHQSQHLLSNRPRRRTSSSTAAEQRQRGWRAAEHSSVPLLWQPTSDAAPAATCSSRQPMAGTPVIFLRWRQQALHNQRGLHAVRHVGRARLAHLSTMCRRCKLRRLQHHGAAEEAATRDVHAVQQQGVLATGGQQVAGQRGGEGAGMSVCWQREQSRGSWTAPLQVIQERLMQASRTTAADETQAGTGSAQNGGGTALVLHARIAHPATPHPAMAPTRAARLFHLTGSRALSRTPAAAAGFAGTRMVLCPPMWCEPCSTAPRLQYT